jgi:hypothetical protein
MNVDILDAIADRFIALGLSKTKEEVRGDLQLTARRLRDIMDRYTRIGSPNDADHLPSFVLESVGRFEDHFVAKVSIDGLVAAATIRYFPGN